jgi:hypothetical protein
MLEKQEGLRVDVMAFNLADKGEVPKTISGDFETLA